MARNKGNQLKPNNYENKVLSMSNQDFDNMQSRLRKRSKFALAFVFAFAGLAIASSIALPFLSGAVATVVTFAWLGTLAGMVCSAGVGAVAEKKYERNNKIKFVLRGKVLDKEVTNYCIQQTKENDKKRYYQVEGLKSTQTNVEEDNENNFSL